MNYYFECINFENILKYRIEIVLIHNVQCIRANVIGIVSTDKLMVSPTLSVSEL